MGEVEEVGDAFSAVLVYAVLVDEAVLAGRQARSVHFKREQSVVESGDLLDQSGMLRCFPVHLDVHLTDSELLEERNQTLLLGPFDVNLQNLNVLQIVLLRQVNHSEPVSF